jgi:hypothetical protein
MENLESVSKVYQEAHENAFTCADMLMNAKILKRDIDSNNIPNGNTNLSKPELIEKLKIFIKQCEEIQTCLSKATDGYVDDYLCDSQSFTSDVVKMENFERNASFEKQQITN